MRNNLNKLSYSGTYETQYDVKILETALIFSWESFVEISRIVLVNLLPARVIFAN